MNRAMEGMGGKVVKKYRIYEKALAGALARLKAQVPSFRLVGAAGIATGRPGERV